MNLQTLKSEKEKVEKQIIHFGSSYFRYYELVAKLEALNLGIQAVEDTIKENGIQQIKDNLHKSFFGTFTNALKNGYTMNEHYIIVDWKF